MVPADSSLTEDPCPAIAVTMASFQQGLVCVRSGC